MEARHERREKLTYPDSSLGFTSPKEMGPRAEFLEYCNTSADSLHTGQLSMVVPSDGSKTTNSHPQTNILY